MNFTEKIKDYIINADELRPFERTLDSLQLTLDSFLQSNKGLHGEYSIEVFQEILRQGKEINGLNEVIASMRRKNLNLKTDILCDLELLKGGKLKLAIDNTSYLISKEGQEINVGRAFE